MINFCCLDRSGVSRRAPAGSAPLALPLSANQLKRVNAYTVRDKSYSKHLPKTKNGRQNIHFCLIFTISA